MDRHRNQTQLACSCRAGASRWTERASSTFSRLAAVPVLVGTWLLHCQSAGCSSAATSFILAEAAAAHWFMLPHDMSCRYHAAIQTQAFTLHGMDLPRLATVRCCELHSCDLLQHFCELHRVLHFNLHHACTWAFDTGRITPATPSRLKMCRKWESSGLWPSTKHESYAYYFVQDAALTQSRGSASVSRLMRPAAAS